MRPLLAALALATAGCAPGNVCGEDRQTLGTRCTQSEDCPRDGAQGVCLQDVSNERACVLCAQTQCVLVTPVSCP